MYISMYMYINLHSLYFLNFKLMLKIGNIINTYFCGMLLHECILLPSGKYTPIKNMAPTWPSVPQCYKDSPL